MPRKIDSQQRARCVRLMRNHHQEYPNLTAAVGRQTVHDDIRLESLEGTSLLASAQDESPYEAGL